MSMYNEFQGALDWAKEKKHLSEDDHRAFTAGTRTAFFDEPDIAVRESLRKKWLAMILDEDWAALRTYFGRKGDVLSRDNRDSRDIRTAEAIENERLGDRTQAEINRENLSEEQKARADGAVERETTATNKSGAPTVGLGVKFFPKGGQPSRDATVTKVHSPTNVDLKTTDEDDKKINVTHIPFSTDGAGRSWNFA